MKAGAGQAELIFVSVQQAGAGTTLLAAALEGRRHKVMGCVLTLSADGSIKFADGSGDITGAMDVAAKGGFVLATTLYPYTQTGLGSLLNLVTSGGAARGVVVLLTEP
jgi:hypothetical protein